MTALMDAQEVRGNEQQDIDMLTFYKVTDEKMNHRCRQLIFSKNLEEQMSLPESAALMVSPPPAKVISTCKNFAEALTTPDTPGNDAG